jgi:hypothetical protein
MKKNIALGLSICLILFSFLSCGKKTTAPIAGKAKPTDMLNLLPVDSQGVFFADIHTMMSIETISKSLEDQEKSKKYFEFIEKTGVNPKEDIFFVAASITAKDPESIQKIAAVINLKYNKDTLLEYIKAKSEEDEQQITEVDHNGVTIYTMEEDGEQTGFAFLDSSNIVAGNLGGIQSVLDVINDQQDNIFKNEELAVLLKETNKDTIFWGTFLVPQEAVEEAASQNPMLQNLKSVSAVIMNFDYKNQSILIDVNIKSSDPEKNEQLANALNGIKSFASMSAQEKPELGELMNKIQITSEEEGIKVAADIPEELMKRITELTKAETEEAEK